MWGIFSLGEADRPDALFLYPDQAQEFLKKYETGSKVIKEVFIDVFDIVTRATVKLKK